MEGAEGGWCDFKGFVLSQAHIGRTPNAEIVFVNWVRTKFCRTAPITNLSGGPGGTEGWGFFWASSGLLAARLLDPLFLF